MAKQEINKYEILEKITPLIENTAMRFGYVPIEIEFVKENHRWFLRIYLYSSEKDVTLDDCEKVTRGRRVSIKLKEPIEGETERIFKGEILDFDETNGLKFFRFDDGQELQIPRQNIQSAKLYID